MDRIHLLVIADDARMTKSLLDMLHVDKDENLCARAMDMAGAQRIKIPMDDVILIDLYGEAEAGFELAERFSRQNPCAQIILLGQTGDYETARRAMAAGASGYFARDEITSDLLLQEHRRILHRVQGMNEWKQRMIRIAWDETAGDAEAPVSGAAARAMEYVRRNYGSNISSADVAAHAGVSESHLRRLFKTEIGMSFVDFLTDCRIEAAKGMMQAGERRTGVIAEQAGFSSVRYFCSVFKKNTGMTTREYMRREPQEP